MSDFPFTEEHLMLRDMVREFVNAEIKPRAHDIDKNECIPDDLIQKIKDLGLLGAAFPAEYGGGGFGEVGYCLMQEEIGRGCLSTATFVGAHQSIGANAIYLGGSEALKKKYLPLLAEGKYIGAFALTEVLAGAGAKIEGVRTGKDLREGESTDVLPFRQEREVLLLQRLTPSEINRVGADGLVRSHERGGR